jgi:hypothetical protein
MYIRQDKLPKLKEYKYSGVDHSLVSRYVMKPFYTHFVIKCFPMSMAYVFIQSSTLKVKTNCSCAVQSERGMFVEPTIPQNEWSDGKEVEDGVKGT